MTVIFEGGTVSRECGKYFVFVSFLQYKEPEDIAPSLLNLDAVIPPNHDLPTIDLETFSGLTSEVDASPLATPITPSTPSVPLAAKSAMDNVEVPVGEEVIRTCVTPRKVQDVQAALEKEVERHRCAVRLLPYFFGKEELKNSNTDGTHGKQCLDKNKLNSLKVLVFSKFPLESAEDRDKQWRFIKTKINARCRASKFAGRET